MLRNCPSSRDGKYSGCDKWTRNWWSDPGLYQIATLKESTDSPYALGTASSGCKIRHKPSIGKKYSLVSLTPASACHVEVDLSVPLLQTQELAECRSSQSRCSQERSSHEHDIETQFKASDDHSFRLVEAAACSPRLQPGEDHQNAPEAVKRR